MPDPRSDRRTFLLSVAGRLGVAVLDTADGTRARPSPRRTLRDVLDVQARAGGDGARPRHARRIDPRRRGCASGPATC
jgi:hypothetical protein